AMKVTIRAQWEDYRCCGCPADGAIVLTGSWGTMPRRRFDTTRAAVVFGREIPVDYEFYPVLQPFLIKLCCHVRIPAGWTLFGPQIAPREREAQRSEHARRIEAGRAFAA